MTVAEGPFAMHIGTLVSEEDGRPWVTVQILGEASGQQVLLAAMKFSPQEARHEAHSFYQAAEAAETSANLVMALREQKVPEGKILSVFDRLKERRGRY